MKRHEVHVLHAAGHSTMEIVRETGLSRSTVKRILKEVPVTSTDTPSPASRGVGRPSSVDEFRTFVEHILVEEPDVLTVELLHRAREKGYCGGKSAFYSLAADLRPQSSSPMVLFEGLPGEFSQHDFGHVVVDYALGAREKIVFFASKLKYSRWVEIRIVPDEKVESLVRALLDSFEAWGGIPLVSVFDNPKTITLGRKGSRIDWNKTFGQVALDYRFAPELCWPRRPNQKGAVENLVGWVKGSFFKSRRFLDRQDLETQLAAWHIEVNHSRPSRATNEIPAARLELERSRLRALAIPPQDYPLHFPVMVGPTAMVRHDSRSYSMPPETIGFPATLYLYPDRVRIVARRYEVVHERISDGKRDSFLPEHRSAMLAEVSGKRARLYFKRQQILELGENAELLLTEIVHRHPRTWTAEVEILFELLMQFGDEQLALALELAVDRELYGARFVQELLERRTA